jgi:tetratricopeptide (TPR) repeat protein
MKCIRMVKEVVIFLSLSSSSLVFGQYKAVDVWETMPEEVRRVMEEKGLKSLYQGKEWRSFREKGLEVLQFKKDFSADFLIYLYYLLTQIGDVDTTKKWEEDSVELQRRIGFLKEAEKLALKSPAKYHQILGLIYTWLGYFYRVIGNHKEALAMEKRFIEKYYDLATRIGTPKFFDAIQITLALGIHFEDAGTPPKEAIAYLQRLSKTHPVREVKLASLVALGREYCAIKRTKDAQKVLQIIERDYADLAQKDLFHIPIQLLRDVLSGKARIKTGRGCCH